MTVVCHRLYNLILGGTFLETTKEFIIAASLCVWRGESSAKPFHLIPMSTAPDIVRVTAGEIIRKPAFIFHMSILGGGQWH